jgi:hypothetical protein
MAKAKKTNISASTFRVEKNLFFSIVSALQKTRDENEKIYKGLESLVEGWPIVKNTQYLDKALIDLMNYLYEGDLFEYWIYELDFGEKWHEGSLTQHGKDLRIKTWEDLYEVLESGALKE